MGSYTTGVIPYFSGPTMLVDIKPTMKFVLTNIDRYGNTVFLGSYDVDTTDLLAQSRVCLLRDIESVNDLLYGVRVLQPRCSSAVSHFDSHTVINLSDFANLRCLT